MFKENTYKDIKVMARLGNNKLAHLAIFKEHVIPKKVLRKYSLYK